MAGGDTSRDVWKVAGLGKAWRVVKVQACAEPLGSQSELDQVTVRDA
jgi:hypothetical protein